MSIKHDVAVELFYSGDWHDHAATGEVYTGEATHGADIKIRHGKGAESGGLTPAAATLVFKGWRFNPDNVSGDLYGLIGRNTPIRITVDGDVRFVGEVSSWTPRQSLGGEVQVPDRWVEVDAGGILRRLEAGTDPLPSALRTYYLESGTDPVAYWPLDSGELSRLALPEFGAASFDLAAGSASFAGADVAAWLEPGVAIGDGVTIAGPVSMPAEPTQWAVDHMRRSSGDARDLDFEVVGNSVSGGGSRFDWLLEFNGSAGQLILNQQFVASGSSSSTVRDTVDVDTFDDQPHHVRLELAQDGADIDWDISIDGTSVSTGTVTSSTMQGISRVEAVSPSGTGPPSGFSHVAVWEGAPPALADTVDAAFGHIGEAAGDRFVRLSGEAGVTDTVTGTAEDTIGMGPQFPGTLAAQYAEIAATDDGIIADTITPVIGVTYKTGRDRYNQTPALTLDYAAAEVAPPLRPIIDDKAIRNDVTAVRRAGASARAVDEASVADVGRYTARPQINPFSDLVVDAGAGWGLHIGTEAGTRFAKVTVDLDATPALADQAVATGIGDRIVIEHLPAELTPDAASLIVVGMNEQAAPDRRRITFNCVTEAPFHIAEVEHDDYAIVGPESTATTSSVTTTQTNISIAATQQWDHEVDFDVVIGGERMTVTAVSVGSGSFPNFLQTLTVVRSVNGVVKTHAADVAIQLFNRAYIGL